MDFVNAYFLSSPASVFVAVVTVAFLLNQAWPRLFRPKQMEKLIPTPTPDGTTSSLTVSKEPEVPEGWWSSREVFELERRALFSKSWLYLAHTSQFSKAGAYQSFDIAGFPIFLIRGKDDKIRAFHNVCRHRAYTVTRKETGTSAVLGCRYHGWSYDTTGRLVKAPQFDDVPGFDKSENSLFEIHAHTTEHGWVFVNLDAGEPVGFESDTSLALERFARVSGVGLKSGFVTGQTLTGAFNWKLGMSARHCADLTTQIEQRLSQALPPSLATKLIRLVTQRNNRAECSIFPGSFLYSFENSDLWISLNLLPASETITQIRYDLFDTSPKPETNDGALANALAEVIQDLIQDIESEFRSINDRPAEGSPATRHILDCLQEHSKLERMRGAQVLPAMRQPKGSSLFQQAEQLCKEIDCAGPSTGAGISSSGLDW